MDDQQAVAEARRHGLRIAAVFALTGAAWILFSDRAVQSLVQTPDHLTFLQTVKGWIFIVATAAFLYWLVVRALKAAVLPRMELERSQRFLATLLGNLPGMVYRCRNDQDWTMEYVSDGALALTGHQPAELIGNRQVAYGQLIHKDDREGVWNGVQAGLARDGQFQLEYRIVTRRGEQKWVWEQGCGIEGADGELIGLEGYIMDVSARKRAEQDLHTQLSGLEALHALTGDLASDLSLERRVQAIAENAVAVLGATRASIQRLGMDGRLRQMFVHESEESRSLESRSIGIPTGEELAERAVKHSKTLTGSGDGLSWAALPMVGHDDVFGALCLWSDEGDFFDDHRLPLTEAFVSQAAASLENARLFEETGRRLQQVRALRQIDLAITASLDLQLTLGVVLTQVTTHLSVDAADILLLDRHSDLLRYGAGRGFRTDACDNARIKLGTGPAGEAALERRTVHVPDISAAPSETLSTFHRVQDEGFATYYALPLVAKGHVNGVLEGFHRSPFKPDKEWLEFLETLAGQAAIAVDNASLFANLQRSNVELSLAYDQTIEGWAAALELRDEETEGHSRRVTEATVRLARAMGIDDEELVHVRRGALLHDIGKIGIPDHILLKPGRLTEQERDIVRQHPDHAFELLNPVGFLRPALDIPYCHHEKWDGTGYPRGLRDEQIPLSARIFAVVDVWDALSSDRPYRSAWPKKKVLSYLKSEAGKHFDPAVVEAFLELDLEDLERSRSRRAQLRQVG